MNSRSFLRMVIFSAIAIPFASAATLPDPEKKKIESLISGLESLKDATFIRNGSEYDAKTAAKFLRGKWDANKESILTARDFIAKAATKSGSTGKPYLIKLKPGTEQTPCADYLNARLKELEK